MAQEGTLLDVTDMPVGSTLVGAHALGATVLNIDDAAPFSEGGGQVLINGVVYTYTGIVDDGDVQQITLSVGLQAAAADEDDVDLYPATGDKIALVDLEDGQDPIDAVIPSGLADRLWDEVRDPDEQETVLVEYRDDEWHVIDVYAVTPEVSGEYMREGTLPATAVTPTQPSGSPVPVVTGMKGSIHLKWPGIANDSAVAYEVHMRIHDPNSTFTPVAGDAATMYIRTQATQAVVNNLPDGSALDYGPENSPQLYDFAIIAVAHDDPTLAASPGTPVFGSMDRVAADDLVASAVIAKLVTAINVEAEQLEIGQPGGRQILQDLAEGFRVVGTDGVNRVHFPTDPAEDLSMTAKLVATYLDILYGLKIFGQANELAAGGGVYLASGVTAPTAPPTMSVGWDDTIFQEIRDSTVGTFYGLTYNPNTGIFYTCWVRDTLADQIWAFDINGNRLAKYNVDSNWKPYGGIVYDRTNDRLILLCQEVSDWTGAIPWRYEVRRLDGTLDFRDSSDWYPGNTEGIAIGWDYVRNKVMACYNENLNPDRFIATTSTVDMAARNVNYNTATGDYVLYAPTSFGYNKHTGVCANGVFDYPDEKWVFKSRATSDGTETDWRVFDHPAHNVQNWNIDVPEENSREFPAAEEHRIFGGCWMDTRKVTVSTTSGSTTITATGSNGSVFSPLDVGRAISGAGIPAGATIATYISATQVTLSAASTATASGVVATVTHNQFVSLNGTGRVFQYEGGGNMWSGSESSTWWGSVAAYDSDAAGTGTHETTLSPRAKVTMSKRAKLVISGVPPNDRGGVDDPDTNRFYLHRGSADDVSPWSATWLQGAALQSVTVRNAKWSGVGNPRATNNFPEGAPAWIKSQRMTSDGLRPLVEIYGDGTVYFDNPEFPVVKLSANLGASGHGTYTLVKQGKYVYMYGYTNWDSLNTGSGSGTFGDTGAVIPVGWRPLDSFVTAPHSPYGSSALQYRYRINTAGTSDGKILVQRNGTNGTFMTIDMIQWEVGA